MLSTWRYVSTQPVKDHTPHHLVMLDEVRRRADDFDVDPFSYRSVAFPADPRLRRSHADDAARPTRPAGPEAVLSRRSRKCLLVSISDSQRRPMPAVNWTGNDPSWPAARPAAVLAAAEGDYLAFLGRRISPEKRPDRAIDIAARAGVPLKIAAKVATTSTAPIGTAIIAPLVARHDNVEFIGEIDETRKASFLGNARALLFPIDSAGAVRPGR